MSGQNGIPGDDSWKTRSDRDNAKTAFIPATVMFGSFSGPSPLKPGVYVKRSGNVVVVSIHGAGGISYADLTVAKIDALVRALAAARVELGADQ